VYDVGLAVDELDRWPTTTAAAAPGGRAATAAPAATFCCQYCGAWESEYKPCAY